ncbi:MAG: high-affinity branched-chain amino acid ABC transporter permease LivM [Pseudomonadota bacterium]
MSTNTPIGQRVLAALKEAGMAGLLTFALTSFIVGLRTEIAPDGLIIEQRWGLVALAVAVVATGRLLLRLFVWGPEGHGTGLGQQLPKLPNLDWLGRFAGGALLLLALLLPFFGGRYVVDLGILVLTYVMLGWGLNIVVGLAGLLDLGYVAFYAVGAYSYALIAHYFGWSFWVCLPLAGLFAATWGMILGFPVLRLRGDYLAIVTLAFGEIIRIVLLNWYEFTGGPDGISGIPRPSFFGIPFDRTDEGFAAIFGLDFSSIHRIIFLYYIILALALLTNAVTLRLRRLPLGRAWEAMREDEIACRSLGINTTNTKLSAFAIGAMFGGFAGAFFATRQGFISPESFVFMESALILAIVVLGGLGSQIGVAIAAIVMIGGFEVFRELEQYRMLIFGAVLVFIMVNRPRGLISSRNPSIVLHERKKIGADLVAQGEGH